VWRRLFRHQDRRRGNAVNDVAAEAAPSTGRLAELGTLIDGICLREGLTDEEGWAVGDETAPADYRSVVAEYETLWTAAYDEAFIRILRRYKFGTVSKLYRTNRPK
jgi:hypothetical protein